MKRGLSVDWRGLATSPRRTPLRRRGPGVDRGLAAEGVAKVWTGRALGGGDDVDRGDPGMVAEVGSGVGAVGPSGIWSRAGRPLPGNGRDRFTRAGHSEEGGACDEGVGLARMASPVGASAVVHERLGVGWHAPTRSCSMLVAPIHISSGRYGVGRGEGSCRKYLSNSTTPGLLAGRFIS